MRKYILTICLSLFIIGFFVIPMLEPSGVLASPATQGGSHEPVEPYCRPWAPGGCLDKAMLYVLTLFGWLMGASGILLNYIMKQTVIDMPSTVQGLSVIDVGWGLFRDLANMAFIFILIFSAISTILGIDTYGAKKILPKLIIVALLMNFSLFFTKIVIDASNVLASGFLTNFEVLVDGEPEQKSFSDVIVGQLRLQTFGELSRDGQEFVATVGHTFLMLMISVIFMFIATMVFFFAAGLFAVRFVVLIFVMIISPLAFVGMILPNASISKKWWDALIAQAFFAPVFAVLIFFVVMLITSPGFTDSVGIGDPSVTAAGMFVFDASVDNDITPTSPLRMVMNYFVIMAFLVASLLVSKSIATSSGGVAAAAFKGTSKFMGSAAAGSMAFAGRHSVGWLANQATKSQYLKDNAEERGLRGTLAKLTLKGAAGTTKASFNPLNSKYVGGAMQHITGGEAGSVSAKSKAGYKGVADRKMAKERAYSDLLDDGQVHDYEAEKQAENAKKLAQEKLYQAREATKSAENVATKYSDLPADAEKRVQAESDVAKAKEDAQKAEEEFISASERHAQARSSESTISAKEAHARRFEAYSKGESWAPQGQNVVSKGTKTILTTLRSKQSAVAKNVRSHMNKTTARQQKDQIPVFKNQLKENHQLMRTIERQRTPGESNIDLGALLTKSSKRSEDIKKEMDIKETRTDRGGIEDFVFLRNEYDKENQKINEINRQIAQMGSNINADTELKKLANANVELEKKINSTSFQQQEDILEAINRIDTRTNRTTDSGSGSSGDTGNSA